MWNMTKATSARPMVTLTSLVGARSCSDAADDRDRPLQLLSRMNRKNAAKTGTYRRAFGPPSEVAKLARPS